MFNEWKPIATAPKDGTKILVYDADDNEVKLVFWHSWRDFYPHAKLQHGWALPETLQDEQGGYAEAYRPIAWMELPEPPFQHGISGCPDYNPPPMGVK